MSGRRHAPDEAYMHQLMDPDSGLELENQFAVQAQPPAPGSVLSGLFRRIETMEQLQGLSPCSMFAEMSTEVRSGGEAPVFWQMAYYGRTKDIKHLNYSPGALVGEQGEAGGKGGPVAAAK